MSDGPSNGKPENNVYTLLMMITVVYMGAGTIFLAVRSQELFGTWNPFSATIS